MELSKLALSGSETQMILEGLDALKSKDFAGDLMSGLFEAMFFDEKKMSPEQLAEHEERKQKKEEVNKQKEIERKMMVKKIELLKAKIVLAADN
jgi:hypothetical protein